MIAGIYKRRESDLCFRDISGTFQETLNQFRHADRTGCYEDDTVLLATALRHTTQSASAQGKDTPCIQQKEGAVALFWGVLTNREELLLKLRGNIELDRSKTEDAEIVLHAYLKWGETFVEHLYGDFSVVIYHTGTKRLFCASDTMAVKPLYYFIDENLFLFSSTLTLFHRLNLVPMNPDLQWAALYTLRQSMTFEETAYRNIFKLAPAHCIAVDSKDFSKRCYFNFDGEKTLTHVSFEECLERYRELLNAAVKSRINTPYPLGSETSGGIDSSTVTALAAQCYKGDLTDFHTFGFANLEQEPGLILKTSQQYALQNNYICCSIYGESSSLQTQRYLDAVGYPCEHGNATFHSPFYEKCLQNDIRTLLSGFGGDEFITSIHTDIALKELLLNRKYQDVYSVLPGNKLTAFLRLLKMGYKVRRPEKYRANFHEAWKSRWPYQPLRSEIVEAYHLEKRYFDTAMFDAGYTNLNQFTLEKRFMPFVPTRMQNCTLIADSYGIDYAWPLLDTPLISYFLSIPTEYKVGKVGRYFHRKAMEGIVPDAVLWKRSKHMGENLCSPLDSRVAPELPTDMHPDLNMLIDVEDVRQKATQSNGLPFNSKMLLHAAIKSIRQMDLWLKTYHPKGANWQNTI